MSQRAAFTRSPVGSTGHRLAPAVGNIRFPLVLLLALASAACAPGDDASADRPAEPPPLALQPPAGEGEDTLLAELNRLQRQLVVALAAPDSATLAEHLDVGSTAVDLSDPPPPTLIERTGSSAAYNYYQLLAGALADRLGDDFAEFVTHESRGETVSYALAPEQAVRTTWRQTDGRWVASRILIMTRTAALRQLEEERAGR